jgi:hypothetical protein
VSAEREEWYVEVWPTRDTQPVRMIGPFRSKRIAAKREREEKAALDPLLHYTKVEGYFDVTEEPR